MIATIYTATCDYPSCTATADMGDSLINLPGDWRDIRSAQRTSAMWRLVLCPDHATAYDAHLPQSRTREQMVAVTCSCGEQLGSTWHSYGVVQKGEEPTYRPESLWWGHLPASLRYAAR